MQNKQTWAKTSLGDTTKNHLKEWLKNQKQPNHFFVVYFKCFHNYKLFFSHVYQFACTNIWLEVYFGLKIRNYF